jgi:hypothetical protein
VFVGLSKGARYVQSAIDPIDYRRNQQNESEKVLQIQNYLHVYKFFFFKHQMSILINKKIIRNTHKN